MKWLSRPAVVGIVATVVTAWLILGVQVLPPPQQVWLRITNAFKPRPPPSETRFRLVLCLLEKDRSGRDTDTVAEAFTGIAGIELVREYSVVSAPAGAADDWRPAIRKSAHAVLKEWNADVAVVGSVNDPGKALSLWFVPREGDDTLSRALTYLPNTAWGGYSERRRDRLAAWRLTLRRAAWYFCSSFSTSDLGTRAMRPSRNRNRSSAVSGVRFVRTVFKQRPLCGCRRSLVNIKNDWFYHGLLHEWSCNGIYRHSNERVRR